jgi:hypothetical protein
LEAQTAALGEQLDPVQPGQPIRIGDLLPQLQGAPVVPVRFGEGAGMRSRPAGGDPGWQCPDGFAGSVPVGSQLSRGDRRDGASELGASGQRLRVLTVEPDPLAGQQVGRDDLAEEGMAELVAVLARLDHQELVGDRDP